MKVFGWDSRTALDEKYHDFIAKLEIAQDKIEWLAAENISINVSIVSIQKDRHIFGVDDRSELSYLSNAMGVRSVYVVKLAARGHVVGLMVVGLSSDAAVSSATSNDEDLINRLGGAVGLALDNKLLLDENTQVLEQLKKSNDKLKALDETKDEFLSMASHQLRTPLTSIKGYVSMVLEGDAGKVSKQQEKLLMEAFKSSERMVGLIADFLNISRLQTGKFVIEKQSFDLREIIEQEVSDLSLIASTHQMKLRLNITGGKYYPVNADESKIRQVIMNFIDNAIYYSHPDSTIVVNLEKNGKNASLTVVDTGIGVPKEEQSHLFNKFFRAKNARKQRPDGTGVGLYLAHRVVAAHGGSIIFSSREGKGSTFGFKIPLSPAEK